MAEVFVADFSPEVSEAFLAVLVAGFFAEPDSAFAVVLLVVFVEGLLPVLLADLLSGLLSDFFADLPSESLSVLPFVVGFARVAFSEEALSEFWLPAFTFDDFPEAVLPEIRALEVSADFFSDSAADFLVVFGLAAVFSMLFEGFSADFPFSALAAALPEAFVDDLLFDFSARISDFSSAVEVAFGVVFRDFVVLDSSEG